VKKIKKSALVPYSARKLFDLVFDVESYPEFLPWCSAAKIISQENNSTTASLSISYRGFNKTFTTLNENVPGQSIHMKLVDGPLQYLDGIWQFNELDAQSCKVELDITFEIANPVMRLALGNVFEMIANSMVEEFVARADLLYGNK